MQRAPRHSACGAAGMKTRPSAPLVPRAENGVAQRRAAFDDDARARDTGTGCSRFEEDDRAPRMGLVRRYRIVRLRVVHASPSDDGTNGRRSHDHRTGAVRPRVRDHAPHRLEDRCTAMLHARGIRARQRSVAGMDAQRWRAWVTVLRAGFRRPASQQGRR